MDSQLSLTLECIVRAGEEWRHITAGQMQRGLSKGFCELWSGMWEVP